MPKHPVFHGGYATEVPCPAIGNRTPLLFKLFMEDEGMISRDAGAEVTKVRIDDWSL
jgi:hypothetical protein